MGTLTGLGVLGLAMVALVFAAPAPGAADDSRGAALLADAALSAHLTAVDGALARHDAATAAVELQAAYQAALAGRRWQGMIAYGDAARRVAEVTRDRQLGLEQARRAYLLALYRARAEGSVDGALAAAQSFMQLGDREVAIGCLSVARRLARTSADRARVRALTARLDARSEAPVTAAAPSL